MSLRRRHYLGIDPGSRTVGWAMLYGNRCINQGAYDVKRIGLGAATSHLVNDARMYGAICAVEKVFEVNHRPGFGSTMATDLVASAHIGARIALSLEHAELEVIEFAAEDWHYHFTERRAIDAQAVKALVTQLVEEWPGVSNPHARDAACVALYAPVFMSNHSRSVWAQKEDAFDL